MVEPSAVAPLAAMRLVQASAAGVERAAATIAEAMSLFMQMGSEKCVR